MEDNIFDSHCHIDFILDRKLRIRWIRNYQQLVHRFPGMYHEKLEVFITNFCDPATWPDCASPDILYCNDPNLTVRYTLGCHPHFAPAMLEVGAEVRLMELLIQGRWEGVVAVGECGLDRSRGNKVHLAVQIAAFKIQVGVAMRLNLPLVLHLRGTEEEGAQVLRDCGLPTSWPIHLHCWNSSREKCEEWLKEWTGSVVGLTGLVSFRF